MLWTTCTSYIWCELLHHTCICTYDTLYKYDTLCTYTLYMYMIHLIYTWYIVYVGTAWMTNDCCEGVTHTLHATLPAPPFRNKCAASTQCAVFDCPPCKSTVFTGAQRVPSIQRKLRKAVDLWAYADLELQTAKIALLMQKLRNRRGKCHSIPLPEIALTQHYRGWPPWILAISVKFKPCI